MSPKRSVKSVVERSDTPEGRSFDLAIQALIVVSIVSFSLETLPTLPQEVRRILRWVEIVTVVVFSVEYVLRLWVARPKSGYVLSFYGAVDLLAVLPFYVAAGLDLRALRALRFLRLFRVFKLVRYSQAVQRLRTALALAREELILFGCVALLLLYLSATGIYYFEHGAQPEAFASVFHSLWWALATLTTVGYGDVYPITLGGRLFTFIILIIGLGVVAAPCGMIAAALSQARELELEEAKETAKGGPRTST